MPPISKHYLKRGDSLDIIELDDLTRPNVGHYIFATAPIYQYDETLQDYIHVGTRYIWTIIEKNLSGERHLAVWAILQRMAKDM